MGYLSLELGTDQHQLVIINFFQGPNINNGEI